MTNHPITPPLELVRQWYQESDRQLAPYYVYMAHRAAQWAADTQLQMDADWVTMQTSNQMSAERLKAEMRPKPPSLKEQALRELGDVYNKGQVDDTTYETIANALKALPND